MKRLFETGKGKNERESWKLPTDNEGFKFEGEKSEVEIDGVGVMDVIDKISDHYGINKEDAGAFIREITESGVDESDEMSIGESDEPSIDDLIVRHFTKELEGTDKSVYDMFSYQTVDVLLKDYRTGEVLYDMKNLEFPIGWSKNAIDIVASKYFKKAGIPDTGSEVSIKQVAHRLALFWTEALKDDGIITTEEQAKIFYDENVYMLLAQIASANSPQYFNTGLKLAYGISGEASGQYYYDKELGKVVPSKDKYTRSQTSACYLLKCVDSLLGDNSIMEHFTTEAKAFKLGSGTGFNASSWRSVGEKLNSGGTSSGLMSFLKPLDSSAGAIKSAGESRRSAKLVVVDDDHPELLSFIQWKENEENKVRSLAKMGYSTEDCYSSVSGQNANNSVMFTNEFMEKVRNLDNNPNETYWLRGRVDSSVDKEVKVKDIWDSFVHCAWSTADPCALYRNNLNEWHTTPRGTNGELNRDNQINTLNPCCEVASNDESSCNLFAINTYRFVSKDGKSFDMKSYIHAINMCVLALEASVEWGQSPTANVAYNTYMMRQLGLGIGNIASMFMASGYPYDSDEARVYAAGLFSLLTAQAYKVSALMAKKVGAFGAYEVNKKDMMRVVRNHAIASNVIKENIDGVTRDIKYLDREMLENIGLNELDKNIELAWTDTLRLGDTYGFRNSQVTVAQPQGTVGFLMDMGATSIEPFFGNMVYKKVVDGSVMQLANPVIATALANLNYSQENISEIMDYIKNHYGNFENAPHLKEEHYPILDTANKNGDGERYIRAMAHVEMVASIAPFITGAVSKTCNLAEDATLDDIEEVFFKAWEYGIKGITVYRDNSKYSQPLNRYTDKNEEKFDIENLTYQDLLQYAKDKEVELANKKELIRVRPNGIRHGNTHKIKLGDTKLYITVNKDEEGNIVELYVNTDKQGSVITGLLNSMSKLASTMIQYGVPASEISKALRGANFEPNGFTSEHPNIRSTQSIVDAISKVIDIELGDYTRVQIKENKLPKASVTENGKTFETQKEEIDMPNSKSINNDESVIVYDKVCGNCGSTKMVQTGVCHTCAVCGTVSGGCA